jgi:hypothetical protein
MLSANKIYQIRGMKQYPLEWTFKIDFNEIMGKMIIFNKTN